MDWSSIRVNKVHQSWVRKGMWFVWPPVPDRKEYRYPLAADTCLAAESRGNPL